MPYCTLDNILDRIDEADVIAYTDDEDTGWVNADRVASAIAAADALIDSHIDRRYAVPVNPAPDMLRDLSVDIAVYKLCSRRSQAPEDRRLAYTDAIKLLEKIQAGKAGIPGATEPSAGSSSDAVSFSSSTRVFSRQSLKGL